MDKMKSVLISIRPKCVEKIANGQKTIEVRKTAPKCEVPFKCYIYCTKPKKPKKYTLHTYINSGYGRKEFGVIGQWRSGKEVVDVNSHLPAYRYNAYLAEGKVIGEFVCATVESFTVGSLRSDDIEKLACLSYNEMISYFYKPEELDGNTAKQGLAWHISDLKIYDRPKELSEFRKLCKINLPMCDRCEYYSTWNGRCENITRVPQGWCYVEEL